MCKEERNEEAYMLSWSAMRLYDDCVNVVFDITSIFRLIRPTYQMCDY